MATVALSDPDVSSKFADNPQMRDMAVEVCVAAQDKELERAKATGLMKLYEVQARCMMGAKTWSGLQDCTTAGIGVAALSGG
jgi:hypothetical protein